MSLFDGGAAAYGLPFVCLPAHECDNYTNEDPVHDYRVKNRPGIAPQVVPAERYRIRQS
jgi:hypothetical protein